LPYAPTGLPIPVGLVDAITTLNGERELYFNKEINK